MNSMQKNVKPLATWTMPPRRDSMAVINAGIEALCRINGFDHMDSGRLQLCLEGVFAYCVNTLAGGGVNEPILVRLQWQRRDVVIVVEHAGPRGQWDEQLRTPAEPVRRLGFDALGLFIAQEILHTLTYESPFDIGAGRTVNRYQLVYRLGSAQKGATAGPPPDMAELFERGEQGA